MRRRRAAGPWRADRPTRDRHATAGRLRLRLLALPALVVMAGAYALTAGSEPPSAAGAAGERRSARPLVRTGAPVASAAVRERCFGAAARDPAARCENPALRLLVTPTPDQAEAEPNAVCFPIGQTEILLPCEFGVRAARARATFALIGDSHASHWRATLARVAQAKGWRGVSLTRSSCPFSRATAALEGAAAAQCARWNHAVLRWLRDHPEISIVFVSQHRGGAVLHPPAVTADEAQIAGYQQLWRALPASVRRVFVVRDTPRDTSRSADCVRRALRARRPAGAACAVPRAFAVKPDPAMTAARRLASPRVRLVDLTRYMCSRRLCRPVVGGALVHRDVDHLTQTFAATLAPYVRWRVEAVLAQGPAPGW